MLSRMLSVRISWRSVWWQACPATPMHRDGISILTRYMNLMSL